MSDKYREIRAISARDRKEIYDFAMRRSRLLQASASEVDDMIEKWHKSDTDISLADWLGMSTEEYALFVEKGELPL